MGELTAEQFAQRAFDLNLLDERQLRDIWGQFGSREVSGEEFRQFLLRRELLTNYQANAWCAATGPAFSMATTRSSIL